jgi:hypothetical protein
MVVVRGGASNGVDACRRTLAPLEPLSDLKGDRAGRGRGLNRKFTKLWSNPASLRRLENTWPIRALSENSQQTKSSNYFGGHSASGEPPRLLRRQLPRQRRALNRARRSASRANFRWTRSFRRSSATSRRGDRLRPDLIGSRLFRARSGAPRYRRPKGLALFVSCIGAASGACIDQKLTLICGEMFTLKID